MDRDHFNLSLATDISRNFHGEILPNESSKVAQLCWMKVRQRVHQFAAAKGLSEKQALEERSADFFEQGDEIHIPVQPHQN